MSRAIAIFAALSIAGIAAPALASSDYLLTLPPAKGEVSPPITVDSWSFGVCNAGQCASTKREAATGMASGKSAKPARGNWDLATGKGARAASGGAPAVIGDIDGDGSPDLAFAGGQDEIYGLTFTVDTTAPTVASACAAGHLDAATLANGSDTFELSNLTLMCGPRSDCCQAGASSAKSGINRIDSTPARISTNLTVARQTQGATFGEKVNQGAASTAGTITMTITGGQMKHTKTGHVTLLK